MHIWFNTGGFKVKVIATYPNAKGANGVDQQKHRYLSLGIVGNEPEERSRIKVIASLSEQ
jgi:hypothetical protein